MVLSSCSGSNGSSSGNGGANASGGNALLGGANHAGGVTASGYKWRIHDGRRHKHRPPPATGGHASLGGSPDDGRVYRKRWHDKHQKFARDRRDIRNGGYDKHWRFASKWRCFWGKRWHDKHGWITLHRWRFSNGWRFGDRRRDEHGWCQSHGGHDRRSWIEYARLHEQRCNVQASLVRRIQWRSRCRTRHIEWTYDVGGNGWGNSELEYYTSGTANASIDGNGNLAITAKSNRCPE